MVVVFESAAGAGFCAAGRTAADTARATVARRVRKDIPVLRRSKGEKCYAAGGGFSLGCSDQGGAEGGGGHAGDFAKGAGEMALIGEAGAKAELGERNVRGKQAFASGADAQAMDMLAYAFANAAAKHAREMDGMDAGFAG